MLRAAPAPLDQQPAAGEHELRSAVVQGEQPRVQRGRAREGGQAEQGQGGHALLDGQRRQAGGQGGGHDGPGQALHGPLPRVAGRGGEYTGLELLAPARRLLPPRHQQDLLPQPPDCPQSTQVQRQRLHDAGAPGKLSPR